MHVFFFCLMHNYCNVSQKSTIHFLSSCQVIMIRYDVVMMLSHYDHYDIGTVKRLLLSVKSEASIACLLTNNIFVKLNNQLQC